MIEFPKFRAPERTQQTPVIVSPSPSSTLNSVLLTSLRPVWSLLGMRTPLFGRYRAGVRKCVRGSLAFWHNNTVHLKDNTRATQPCNSMSRKHRWSWRLRWSYIPKQHCYKIHSEHLTPEAVRCQCVLHSSLLPCSLFGSHVPTRLLNATWTGYVKWSVLYIGREVSRGWDLGKRFNLTNSHDGWERTYRGRQDVGWYTSEDNTDGIVHVAAGTGCSQCLSLVENVISEIDPCLWTPRAQHWLFRCLCFFQQECLLSPGITSTVLFPWNKKRRSFSRCG